MKMMKRCTANSVYACGREEGIEERARKKKYVLGSSQQRSETDTTARRHISCRPSMWRRRCGRPPAGLLPPITLNIACPRSSQALYSLPQIGNISNNTKFTNLRLSFLPPFDLIVLQRRENQDASSPDIDLSFDNFFSTLLKAVIIFFFPSAASFTVNIYQRKNNFELFTIILTLTYNLRCRG